MAWSRNTRDRLRRGKALEAVRNFIYGLTGYEFARHASEMKREAEALFMLVTLGNMIGLPLLAPMYSLRLLPYLTPRISAWKRQLAGKDGAREAAEYHHLHGL
ncbi:MAG TPA: hypothetical protein VNO43_18770 [Candidatus Eisenbacteria bacterium]|nr:hypothetical protein [Candidatus Eisenbacteria bacterium]